MFLLEKAFHTLVHEYGKNMPRHQFYTTNNTMKFKNMNRLRPRPRMVHTANALRRHTYQDSIARLNGLQSSSEYLEQRRSEDRLRTHQQKLKRLGQVRHSMKAWLDCIGIAPESLNSLNVIHVAGTNGKGSTCAYIQDLLIYCQEHLGRPSKVALYTSPHLFSVRERIRINGNPISEREFTEYFFDVYDKLANLPKDTQMPSYFRFMTLLFFYVSTKIGADATVVETGLGGEYDTTNVVSTPVATIITRIGKDHMNTLGPTIEDVAWHKAGIFKAGCPALSVQQQPRVRTVLERRAQERNTTVDFMDLNHDLTQLRMPDVQKANASVALASVAAYIKSVKNITALPPRYVERLEALQWPGRFQVITQRSITWCVDGAHNEDGIEAAAEWFVCLVRSLGSKHRLILMFNNAKGRNTQLFLEIIHRIIYSRNDLKFADVIFTGNTVPKNASTETLDVNSSKDAEMKNAVYNVDCWKALDACSSPRSIISVPEALDVISRDHLDREAMVLVTGSLHLVGRVLVALQPSELA